MLYDSPVRYGDQRCSNDAGLFDVTGLSLEFWQAVGVPDKADWAGSGAGIFGADVVEAVIRKDELRKFLNLLAHSYPRSASIFLDTASRSSVSLNPVKSASCL